MAINLEITPKPHIWLHGIEVKVGDQNSPFSRRVDHAIHIAPVSMNTVNTGITVLDKENILTFYKKVRIIITAQCGPRKNHNSQAGGLGDLKFEGSISNSNKDTFNHYAETYFTVNGKDPVRNRAYLYKYQDMDDLRTTGDPSFQESNINTLGLVLYDNPTGCNLITLKARTFHNGKASKVAIAYFKIAKDIQASTANNSYLE